MADLSNLHPLVLTGAAVGMVVLLVAMITNLRWSHIAVASMFFLSTISVAKDWVGLIRPQWLYPLQSSRSAVYLVFGIVLTLAVIGRNVRQGRKISIQGGQLLLMGLYAALLRIAHDGMGPGLASILFASLTIGPLLVVLPALMDDWDDLRSLLRTFLFADAVWIAGVAVQFAIAPKQLTSHPFDRFMGLTANAQSAALLTSTMIVFALWLVLNDPKRRYFIFYLAILGINVVMLVWTGSRTGAIMCMLGVVVAVYGRVGRTILALPIIAVVGYAGFRLAAALNVSFLAVEHIVSTEDTRTQAWLILLEVGLQNPVIGAGINSMPQSENSYLYGFAAYGLGMAMLLLVYVVASARLMLRLFALRGWMDPAQRTIIDLILAYNAMYFAGAIVEGFIVGRIASHLVLMLAVAAIATRTLELAEEDAAAVAEADEWEWQEQQEQYAPA